MDNARVDVISAQLRRAAGAERLQELLGEASGFDAADAILDEAQKFAEAQLKPLNRVMDHVGCRIENGRVLTTPGHKEVWEAYVEGGWPTLDQPEVYGGQGLALALGAAVQEIFDGASGSFGMLPTLQKAASKLLLSHASEAIKAEWLPNLASGHWGATICISEAGAGSDVGRIRTLATPLADGGWSITGEKMWISYGDHDLTERIGHCLLARTPDAAPGGAGLSLFLVSDQLPDGSRNAITPRRVEEKLGLHGSPTCALGFEGARGELVGTIGRGLAQLFAMITSMRLSVGIQGLGIAAEASAVALAYAAERGQGGPPNAPPVTIDQHADVKRVLMNGASRVEVLRGLVLTLAVQVDLARLETDPAAKEAAAALSQWLLPIVKTAGGEAAFSVADGAIQVLGGAGYVSEWPVEQSLRDARVFTVYEGTTGMQALDMLHRRLWRDAGKGQAAFLKAARADLELAQGAQAVALEQVLTRLEDTATALLALQNSPVEAEAGATAYLDLCFLASTGWIAARLAQGDHGSADGRLKAAGKYWLSDLDIRAAQAQALALIGAERLGWLEDFRQA